jgi:NAD(P)-dependent dehydrogenase (short-subunit alcohol dehydrogenase family)
MEHVDLHGQVALVVGGSRGLGFEISRGLSAAGAKVIVASRKLDGCQAASAAIASETGQIVVPHQLDIGRWSEAGATVDWVYETLGRLDVLVNCAGLSPLYSDLSEVSEKLFDKVIDVNLKGPFRIIAAAGPRMAAAGGGSIINISSIGAVRPGTGELPYCAAKSGLNALTQGFAQAWAPSVRVNCVLPGAFKTDMTSGWPAEIEERVLERLPAGRKGEASEITSAVLYFASPASSYTTGAMLTVDGGRCAVL